MAERRAPGCPALRPATIIGTMAIVHLFDALLDGARHRACGPSRARPARPGPARHAGVPASAESLSARRPGRRRRADAREPRRRGGSPGALPGPGLHHPRSRPSGRTLLHAAREEHDHLAWCQQRVQRPGRPHEPLRSRSGTPAVSPSVQPPAWLVEPRASVSWWRPSVRWRSTCRVIWTGSPQQTWPAGRSCGRCRPTKWRTAPGPGSWAGRTSRRAVRTAHAARCRGDD